MLDAYFVYCSLEPTYTFSERRGVGPSNPVIWVILHGLNMGVWEDGWQTGHFRVRPEKRDQNVFVQSDF